MTEIVGDLPALTLAQRQLLECLSMQRGAAGQRHPARQRLGIRGRFHPRTAGQENPGAEGE